MIGFLISLIDVALYPMSRCSLFGLTSWRGKQTNRVRFLREPSILSPRSIKVTPKHSVNFVTYIWMIGGAPIPVFEDLNKEVFKKTEVTFAMLTHLDNIGIIILNNMAEFMLQNIPKISNLYYHGMSVESLIPLRPAAQNVVAARAGS